VIFAVTSVDKRVLRDIVELIHRSAWKRPCGIS
jgi:hypothetical protein